MDRPGARPLDALCHDIVERYHAPLHRTLPLIREDLASLSSTGASREVNMMRLAFSGLADEIEFHLCKEEQLLFPACCALAAAQRDSTTRLPSPFASVLHPIRMIEAEQVRIESGLGFVRGLALDVCEPVTMLPAWRRCMDALSALDVTVREHHRAENAVLFPRALDTERELF